MRDRLSEHPTWFRYTLGVLLAAMAVCLRLLMDRYVTPEAHAFLFFYPAIIVAGMYLGIGPAVGCTAVCVASIAYFIVPVSRWFNLAEPLDITDIGVFVVLAGLLIWLTDSQRRVRERTDAARREVEQYARELEREAAERKRVENALRQSNSDLEDFTHIVSHDLKEPLRGISMTAQFMLDDFAGKLGPEGKTRLETLVRLPRRMAAMLDALLDYSRAWRAELGISDTDLFALTHEVVDSLRPWLAEHHAEVVIGQLPTLRCDRVRVGQVLSNLITNAVKYNESTPKRVEIGCGAGGAIYVKDNGIGIPKSQMDQVFRMFRRLHGKDSYGGGTGSGLALVKKTVERHGGRTWIESTPGQGSTFWFVLGAPAGPPAGRSAGERDAPHAEVKQPQSARA